MLNRIQLVGFILASIRSSCNGSSQFLERMLRHTEQLCPGANICPENMSTIDTETSQGSTLRSPCCTDCSCDPGCLDTGNCCFPNGLNALRKDDIPTVQKEVRQCLYPISRDVTDGWFYRSYYMIASQYNRSVFQQNEGCGNQKTVPWGSLHPVFSKQTRKIYKNEACAEVNNITDGISWDTVLKCKNFDPETFYDFDLANVLFHLGKSKMPNYCHVHFVYPGELDDIKSQICYKGMIDYCTAAEFRTPVAINFTKDEISEACQSGLISPYVADKLYANVFCFICTGSTFRENYRCPNVMEDPTRTKSSSDFAAMLNPDILLQQEEQPMADDVRRNELIACQVGSQQNSSECRPVLCPTGQLRNKQGNCIFSTKMWYRQNCEVAIQLSTDHEIDIMDAFNWGIGQHFTNIDTLSLSRPFKEWAIRQVHYEIAKQNEFKTNHLLVLMRRFFESESPAYITRNIAQLINTKWRLHYGNISLILEPTQSKLKQLVYNDGILTSGSFKVNDSFRVISQSYRRFYTSFMLASDVIMITKLYFCNQIELQNDEFILSQDNKVLHNRLSGTYLFDGEFTVVHVHNGVLDIVVRVCLENSGFDIAGRNNGADIFEYNQVMRAFALPVIILIRNHRHFD